MSEVGKGNGRCHADSQREDWDDVRNSGSGGAGRGVDDVIFGGGPFSGSGGRRNAQFTCTLADQKRRFGGITVPSPTDITWRHLIG